MSQWFLTMDGQQIGPLTLADAQEQVRQQPQAFAWREGFSDWLPASQIAELAQSTTVLAPPPLPPGGVAPTRCDEIDFTIFGSEMQFVEIELDPAESVIAEAGAMMYKDSVVEMEAIFGDGSRQETGGLMGKLIGAGKRVLTGESLFMTVFTHQGSGKAKVAFGAPYPGNIIPLSLKSQGGTLICQKDAFLCAARGVSVGIHLQRKILTGLFGGEGFIMQKLEGDGMVFLHAGGTIVERQLQAGEELHVDTGCMVAYEPQVSFDIQQAGNIKTALLGGEGLFFARLRGPGKIWLQSLPFSRLAGRMLQAAPQRGGSKGEGSILGGLGNLLDGDNR
jgi:uncharacterized protein (TIGR00266 family)